MRVEQRTTSPVRREAPPTYFVGRRLFEAAEIFAVTARQVERLHSLGRHGARSLDWHGGEDARIELSNVLISRVAEERPTHELQARFALYVLERLPDGGFVLDSDDVWSWLRVASEPRDFVAAEHPSWTGRLRAFSRRPGTGSRHA
jgi:hypothetical protein